MPLDKQFSFNLEALQSQMRAQQSEYAQAEPFPHLVIDDFFPVNIAERLVDEFPGTDQGDWDYSGDGNSNRQHKYISTAETQLGPLTRWVLYQLIGGRFLQSLETLTGIAHLLPDPNIDHTLRHFTNGGRLGVHVDFNWNKQLQLYRRMNMIIYLNQDWKSEYGGELELWDPDRNVCVRKVTPGWNRAIVFATSDRTPHGFPTPLNCPAGVSRKSIQLYYYTSAPEDPSQTFKAHGTVFQASGQQGQEKRRRSSSDWRKFVKEITPPIMLKAIAASYRKISATDDQRKKK